MFYIIWLFLKTNNFQTGLNISWFTPVIKKSLRYPEFSQVATVNIDSPHTKTQNAFFFQWGLCFLRSKEMEVDWKLNLDFFTSHLDCTDGYLINSWNCGLSLRCDLSSSRNVSRVCNFQRPLVYITSGPVHFASFLRPSKIEPLLHKLVAQPRSNDSLVCHITVDVVHGNSL